MEMKELKLMWFMLRDLRWKAIGVNHGIKMIRSLFVFRQRRFFFLMFILRDAADYYYFSPQFSCSIFSSRIGAIWIRNKFANERCESEGNTSVYYTVIIIKCQRSKNWRRKKMRIMRKSAETKKRKISFFLNLGAEGCECVWLTVIISMEGTERVKIRWWTEAWCLNPYLLTQWILLSFVVVVFVKKKCLPKRWQPTITRFLPRLFSFKLSLFFSHSNERIQTGKLYFYFCFFSSNETYRMWMAAAVTQ